MKGQLLGRASRCRGDRGPSLFALPLLRAGLSVFGVLLISVPVCIVLFFLLLPSPCSKAKGHGEALQQSELAGGLLLPGGPRGLRPPHAEGCLSAQLCSALQAVACTRTGKKDQTWI